jgi:peptidoglycan/xylan/chitin deacetylase (PgdA/CDA1 family)
MGRYEYGQKYRSRRRKRQTFRAVPMILGGIVLLAVCGYGAVTAGKILKEQTASGAESSIDTIFDTENGSSVVEVNGEVTETTETAQEIELASPLDLLLEQADRIAAGYDYDGAIELLKSDAEYADAPEVQEAAARYEETRSTLVSKKISEVTHVFFHSLIVDPAKAFDGEKDQDGFNQVMTTVDEFKKILQTMYDEGYVLVRLHDMAYETVDENGKSVMKAGTILLPEDKKPFVMSQDDVCYYPYMDGDGFASRMVIGADGKPTTVMTMDDGTEQEGAYDLIPILEEFIEEHPDFSYKGARAVIAFTGYEGVMGYRTASSYAQTNPNYEQDKETVRQIAQALKDNGWELASHSWGHLNLGTVEWERFKTDCDKWQEEVNSLIGPTDIILFPFGADVGDWHPYTHENERYDYLYNEGFRYFCTVDSTQYWVQIGDDSMRQGRRNLDGYRMWKDITAESEGRERKLADLFRAEDVFDSARPTPVPEI